MVGQCPLQLRVFMHNPVEAELVVAIGRAIVQPEEAPQPEESLR